MNDSHVQDEESRDPVFNEPWEAQLFSLISARRDQQLISADEWAQALGSAIKQAQQAGDPDLGDTYYQRCLCALERLLVSKDLAKSEELKNLVNAWRSAYLATPHGKPVALSAQHENSS